MYSHLLSCPHLGTSIGMRGMMTTIYGIGFTEHHKTKQMKLSFGLTDCSSEAAV